MARRGNGGGQRPGGNRPNSNRPKPNNPKRPNQTGGSKPSGLQAQIAAIRKKANQQGWTQERKQKAIQNARAKADTKEPRAKLSMEELRAQYPWAAAIMDTDPQILGLFKEALKSDWSGDKFNAKLQATQWYQSHSASFREATALKQADPATWNQQLSSRVTYVQAQAQKVGARISRQQAATLAEQAIFSGWDDAQVQQILGGYITYSSGARLGGAAGETELQLKKLASANGVDYSDDFYLSAARQVATGDAMIEDWEAQIRETAAQTYKPWAAQIRNGMDVRDLASPYIRTMEQILEIPEWQISLKDPTLRKAIANVSPEGEMAVSPLWQFERELRRDSRWVGTKGAQNEITNVADNLLKAWGLSE